MASRHQTFNPTIDLARKLIIQQFPEYAHLPVSEVEQQGHDNRTYRLGSELIIRMPVAQEYALKVDIEQELLPKLASHLKVSIPIPLMRGLPSKDYPYPFSIYRWLEGTSINLLRLETEEMEHLALDLATFLKDLQSIRNFDGPAPGQHNWWRGDHLSVYDKGAREQIARLADVIDSNKAIDLWERACATRWSHQPVWIHGDLAIGNILMEGGRLSAIIDFGGAAMGDPACDLVIAWTYLSGKARDIFIREINLDDNTWLRARAWALWKATFELDALQDKDSLESLQQRKIIDAVMNYGKDYTS